MIDEAVGNGAVGGDDLQAGAPAVQLRAGDGQGGENIVFLGIVDGDGIAFPAHEAAAAELDVQVGRTDKLAVILTVQLRRQQQGRAFRGGAAVAGLVFVPVARAGDDRLVFDGDGAHLGLDGGAAGHGRVAADGEGALHRPVDGRAVCRGEKGTAGDDHIGLGGLKVVAGKRKILRRRNGAARHGDGGGNGVGLIVVVVENIHTVDAFQQGIVRHNQIGTGEHDAGIGAVVNAGILPDGDDAFFGIGATGGKGIEGDDGAGGCRDAAAELPAVMVTGAPTA